MKLTERQAIEKSIELWEWLAETGEDKDDWLGWKRNGGKYSGHISGDCFLCEYTKRLSCTECPYNLHYKYVCQWDNTPYANWEGSYGNIGQRKRYAQQFLIQLKALLDDKEKLEA